MSKHYVFQPGVPLRITAQHKPGDHFIVLITPKRAVTLTLSEQRRLYDKEGGEWACEDETLMKDLTDRTGVWPFVLPEGHWTEIASKPHDFVTSCLAYQLHHPRSEAEEDFRRNLFSASDTIYKKTVSLVLSEISEALSWNYWDVPETRWK